MALKSAKCEQCGANIEIDEDREFGFCPFCGTKYYTEKIVNNTYVTNNYAGANIIVQDVGSENYVKLAEGFFGDEEYDEAMKYISEGLPKNPEDPDLWRVKLMCSMRYARFSEDYPSAQSKVIDDYKKYYKYATDKNQMEEVSEWIIEEIECLQLDILEGMKNYRSIIDNRLSSKADKEDAREKFEEVKHERRLLIYCLLRAILFDNNTPKKGLDYFFEKEMELYQKSQTGAGNYLGIADRCTMLESIYNYESYAYDDIPSDLKFTNKKGKEKSASYYGSLIIYEIKKRNPDYTSEAYEKFKEILNEKEKKGCYIATAVYGSYDCPSVWTLRRFRDNVLGKTWYGRAFIKTYYAISPTLVKYFGETKWFKKLWKNPLDKMVEHLRKEGVSDLPYNDLPW